MKQGIVVVGIDPGREAGLVALSVPGTMFHEATWLGHAVMRPTQSVRFSHPERDWNFAQRIATWVEAMKPDLVVLEEPFEAADVWTGQRHGRRERRGTGFRRGVYYHAAVAAIGLAAPNARMASYPPTTWEDRRGWMRRKRPGVLREAALLARTLKAPLEVYDVDDEGDYQHEHVLMALGVLAHHWTTHRDPLAVTEAVA